MPSVPELFSPAKMVLLAYGFLVWKSPHPVSSNLKWWLFAFLAVEIFHNDCLRLALNGLGEGWKERLKNWASDARPPKK